MVPSPLFAPLLRAACAALLFSGTAAAQSGPLALALDGERAAVQGAVVPPAQPGDARPGQQSAVRFRNRFRPDVYLAVRDGAPVAAAGGADAAWQVEPVTGEEPGFVRLRAGGAYLHVQDGPPRMGGVQPGWWSAMWVLEPVAGTEFVRIRNRWKNTYLHTEGGALEIGEAQPGWWSAMWAVQRGGGAQPPDRIRGDPPVVVDGPPVRWVAWVKTGDRFQAGTDANIRLYVRGTRGQAGPFLLDRSGHDDFESGDLARYELGQVDIGSVQAVLLANDGANSGADWYLEWVCVQPEHEPPCRDNRDSWFRFDNWVPGNAQTLWQTRGP